MNIKQVMYAHEYATVMFLETICAGGCYLNIPASEIGPFYETNIIQNTSIFTPL